jgi:hypothetical protein
MRSFETPELDVGEKIRLHSKDSISMIRMETSSAMGTLFNGGKVFSRSSDTESTSSTEFSSHKCDDNEINVSHLKVEKIVSFSQLVEVAVIPSRHDQDVETNQALWWLPHDIDSFKMEACFELEECMRSSGCDLKQALTQLYQP